MKTTDLNVKFSGKRLKMLRQTLRKTQTETAFLLGITPQSYGEMEKGKITPSSTNLYKLCRVFECEVASFFEAV